MPRRWLPLASFAAVLGCGEADASPELSRQVAELSARLEANEAELAAAMARIQTLESELAGTQAVVGDLELDSVPGLGDVVSIEVDGDDG